MGLQPSPLIKPTCQFRKDNGEFCKRGVAPGQTRCWQHAATIEHKLRSLTHGQKAIALGLLIGAMALVIEFPSLYFSYVGARPIMFKEHVTPENIEGKVKTWLTNPRVSFRPIYRPGTLFALEVTNPRQGQIIEMQQSQVDSNYLTVGVIYYVTDQEKAECWKLSSEQREELKDVVSQEIAKTGMEYTVDTLPESILVYTAVPITDDLNENVLDNTIVRIVDASIVTRLAFARNLHSLINDHPAKKPS